MPGSGDISSLSDLYGVLANLHLIVSSLAISQIDPDTPSSTIPGILMFERCTEPARRAIFYARAITLLSDAAEITSVDLLGGLLWEDDSRAETIFQLRERFPVWGGRPYKFAALPDRPDGPPLDKHSKMILAWTEMEATRMRDYWIDTEHLLLGILRVRKSPAAQYLAMTSLTLDAARKTIEDNKASRPHYGRVPRWWPIKAWLVRGF